MQLPQAGKSSASPLLIMIVLVGGLLMGFLNMQIADEENRAALQDRAETIAYSLGPEEIIKLSGTAADADTVAYRELKSRLTALKQLSGDIRAIYLSGIARGEIFFLVDSESPDSDYYSSPGELYPEATIAFKNLFAGNPAMVEGPLADSFGNWISALAPIVNVETGEVVAVVGIDIDASAYNQALLFAAAPPVVVSVMLVAVIGIYEWRRRREQQLLRLRSELVSIASHELRTPITGIRWAIERLIKKTAGTPHEQGVKNVYDNVLHLQGGVEDILQLTHVTNQKYKLELAPCNMSALIKEVCDTQSLAAEQKQVKLVIDDSWKPLVNIVCDADRFKRALHNVVSNAIKYTRDGTEVVIHYERGAKDHRIIVIDHGIGIPEAEQSRVFGGFYRASNAKATGTQGTGLGLYLTRTILQQHKGTITFVSEEGKGTTFVMSLPVR